MRRAQEKELRRLEEALMEVEESQEALSMQSEEPDWDTLDDYERYDVYNTDDADVDMDAYSEDVHRGKGGNGLSIVITMVAMVALSAGVLYLLKLLEVL